ncbi:MAG: AsmA-like C-terminal region-containing protein [Bacteroidota bacterium]
MRIRKGVKYGLITVILLAILAYSVAFFYRVEILRYVNTELNKKVKGEVSIKDVNLTIFRHFPDISLTLLDVLIKDSLYHRETFKAEKIYLQLDLQKLLFTKLVVQSVFLENASISLFQDGNGYSNLSVLKSKPTGDSTKASSSLSWMVQRVGLHNVSFSYEDTLKKKNFQFQFIENTYRIQDKDSTWQMQMAGNMYFGGIGFNTSNGRFLDDKKAVVDFQLAFVPATKQLLIYPSKLLVEEELLELSGHFFFTEPARMQLVIENKRANYAQVASMLTANITKVLNKYQIQGPLNVKATLSGELKSPTPHAHIIFSSEKAQIKAFSKNMDDVQLEGFFDNQVKNTEVPHDTNSILQMNRLDGKFYGLPVNLSFKAVDLKAPKLTLNAGMDVGVRDMEEWLHPIKFKLSEGRFKLNFDYQVNVQEFKDPLRSPLAGKLNGVLRIINGRCRLLTRDFDFNKINAEIPFDKTNAHLTKLNFQVNQSQIHVLGELKNVLPFLLLPKQAIKADLQLHSPFFDLEPVLKKDPNQNNFATVSMVKTKYPYVLDNILSQIELAVQVNIQKLQLRKFIGANFTGHVSTQNNGIQLNNIRMQTSEGSILMDGYVAKVEGGANPFNITGSVSGVDVSQFFYSCENFNQRVIQSDNLKGKLDANFNFKGEFDEGFKVVPESMGGFFNLKLKDGGLYNFESLQQISKIIFKKRDFMNIKFATINNSFTLQGKNLKIDRTEIASSVLSFFVEGTYSFANNTDLSIQVPLSNLKKREKDYVPTNEGVYSDVGNSIYIRGRNKEGKLHFGLDLFNRYAKDKSKLDQKDAL